MKLFQILLLLSSINLFSNDLKNVEFIQNTTLWNESTENSHIESNGGSNGPIYIDEESAPISDYQGLLLIGALGIGVYYISNKRKVKAI